MGVLNWKILIVVILLALAAVQYYRIDIYRKDYSGPPTVPVMYIASDESGRVHTYTFLADQRVLYTRALEVVECIELMEFEGEYGNRFFNTLWKTDVPQIHWSQKFTVVDPDYVPVSLTMEVKKMVGEGCLGVPQLGSTFHRYAEFSDKNLKLGNEIYVRFEDSSQTEIEISQTLALLE